MKNFFLLIIAIVLFAVIVPIGMFYTALYYIFKERTKGYSYFRRCAFSIDVFGNCACGELFELLFAKKRSITYFGYTTSISAALGHLQVNGMANAFGIWFSALLDKLFREKDHCLNAYRQEITDTFREPPVLF